MDNWRVALDRAERLQRLTLALARCLDEAEVTAVVLREGVEALGASAATLHLAVGEGDTARLRLLGAVGYPDEVAGEYADLPLASAMPVAAAARDGEPRWIADVPAAARDNPELLVWHARTGNASGAALPLRDGHLRGAMSLTFAEPHDFPPDERAFMLTLANVCAQAYDRAALYDEARAALRRSEAAEAALRRSESRFRALFDVSPAGALVVTFEEGRVVDANAALLRLFGWTREEVLGRTTRELGLWADLADREEMRRAVRERGSTVQRDVRGRTKDGRELRVLGAYTLLDLDDEPHLLAVLQDFTERARLTDELRLLSLRDSLTGLPNRRALDDHLPRLLDEARARGERAALLYLDLARFRHVNDTLGRTVGDELLRLIARRLEEACAGRGLLARLDGAVFVVARALPEGREDDLAARLLAALHPPFRAGGYELHVSGNVGVALFPHDAEDLVGLHRAASAALGRAKGRGPDRAERYAPELAESARERLGMEADLRRALAAGPAVGSAEGEGGEVIAHFQPIVDAVRREVVAWEALARWRHPRLGLLPPGRFLPVAEDSGLVAPLGEVVLARACREAAAWRARGRRWRVSVNVSALQFERGDLAGKVARELARHGLDGAALELEVPETSVMRDPVGAAAQLHALRALGVRVAVDDFGTGYSNLAHLRNLPVDTLKVDRSFLRGLGEEPGALAVVEGILVLADRLGLRSIVEGVETESQLALLRGVGVRFVQGFLFARPLPPEDVGAFTPV